MSNDNKRIVYTTLKASDTLVTRKKRPRPTECSTGNCTEDVRAKGLCNYHYQEMFAEKKRELSCVHENCEKPQRRRGLCSKHYNLKRRNETCHNDFCKKIIYRDGLCNKHFIQLRGRCAFRLCESRNIFCIDKMLCKYHYKVQLKYQKQQKNTHEKDVFLLNDSIQNNN